MTDLPTISEGATGPVVRWAQYLLVRRTLSDDQIDGIFGPVTKAAVEQFQSDSQLAVDGIVGPATWLALIITVKQGSQGDAVRGVQEEFQFRNLSGDPSKGLQIDGIFGPDTDAAVRGFQQALHLDIPSVTVDGIVGPATWAALSAGVVPQPRSTSGYVIEIDLELDLIMVVNNGHLQWTLNTSTGGGYTYTEDGQTDVAITPTGTFSTFRVVDGTVTDSLGTLYRPRFFYQGYAIHGDSSVPPEPVSHGCARISNEAIDWIWAANIDPIGTIAMPSIDHARCK